MKERKKRTPRVTVWIIDDNKHFCILLKESLKNRPGRNVSYFFSIAEALAGAKKKRTAPDVVLLDIGMPEMNGIDGIDILQSEWPEVRIIMLTSHDEEKAITRSLRMGAAGYLLKTSSAEDIDRSIDNVMAGGSPLDPNITSKIIDLLLVHKEYTPRNYRLTAREVDVVHMITKGLTTVMIAEELNISYFTINTHLKNIYRKLKVHSKPGLVAKAFKDGIVGD